jgi:hypothetical protein
MVLSFKPDEKCELWLVLMLSVGLSMSPIRLDDPLFLPVFSIFLINLHLLSPMLIIISFLSAFPSPVVTSLIVAILFFFNFLHL